MRTKARARAMARTRTKTKTKTNMKTKRETNRKRKTRERKKRRKTLMFPLEIINMNGPPTISITGIAYSVSTQFIVFCPLSFVK
jgi:hypothetical protein